MLSARRGLYTVLMASVPEWLWTVAGWAAIAFGVVCLVRGRMSRRAHRDDRCYACNYDMTGNTTGRCPECGRAADQVERWRSRPLKRWRYAGLVILLIGWALTLMPGVLMHGWPAAVPSCALAWLGPANRGEKPDESFSQVTANDSLARATKDLPKSLAQRVREELYDEMYRRITTNNISELLRCTYLRRKYAALAMRELMAAAMPSDWPWDAPAPTLGGNANISLVIERLTGPSDRMRVWAVTSEGGNFCWLCSVDCPVDARLSTDEFMTAFSSPALDKQIWSLSKPQLIMFRYGATVHIASSGKEAEWRDVPRFGVCTVRVLLDGQVLGTGERDPRSIFGGVDSVRINWVPGGFEKINERPDDAEVELSGSPRQALKLYDRNWPAKREAWRGSVRGKPEIELWEQ